MNFWEGWDRKTFECIGRNWQNFAETHTRLRYIKS